MAFNSAVLAFDTSGPFCAAAVLIDGKVTACRANEMARGQAEAIMDIIEDVLERSSIQLDQLTRIGVGTGPGNFTGIRIAVSAARGFALSLKIPAIGINGFEATLRDQPDDTIACLPALRDQLYFAGRDMLPQMGTLEQIARLHRTIFTRPEPLQFVQNIAHLAGNAKQFARAVPMYVKPADAAPARELPPRVLDDTA